MLIIAATWIWTWHNSLQETGTTTNNGRGHYRSVHHPERNQKEWISSAVDPCHGRRRRRHDGYELRQANLRARDDLRQAVGEHHQQGRGSHHSAMRLQGQQPGQFRAREPAKLLLRLLPKHLGEHLVLVQLHMARAHVVVWKGHGFLGVQWSPCDYCVWVVMPEGFYRAQVGQVPMWVQGWQYPHLHLDSNSSATAGTQDILHWSTDHSLPSSKQIKAWMSRLAGVKTLKWETPKSSKTRIL